MASSIMALAIATSVTTLQRGFANIDSARNLSLAGQIIQTELEKIRMKNWATLNNTELYPTARTQIAIDPLFNNVSGLDRFSLFRTISTPQTGMRQITFEITWSNYDGRTMTRSYTTFYSQFGLYDYFYNSRS